LTWTTSKVTNSWVAQYQGSKSARVWLAMTTSTKMRIPSLVSTISTHWPKELNMFKESTCNCSHPTWKLTSHRMETNVSQTASWVLMHSLLWAQHKKWIPIKSMGCVHTRWGILAIEGWGNPNHIRNIVEENRKLVENFGRLIKL